MNSTAKRLNRVTSVPRQTRDDVRHGDGARQGLHEPQDAQRNEVEADERDHGVRAAPCRPDHRATGH